MADNIAVLNVVWGEEYSRFFVEFSLPTFLAQIEAVWEGPAYQALRASIRAGRDMDATCFRCQLPKRKV